jgi:hypothetical protein
VSAGAMIEITGFVLYIGGALVYGIDLTRGKTQPTGRWFAMFLTTGRGALVQISGESCWAIHHLMDHDFFGAALNGVWIAGLVWNYFKHGGGKGLKKAALELGEKSRARIQTLVDNLDPSPIPSPVGVR